MGQIILLDLCQYFGQKFRFFINFRHHWQSKHKCSRVFTRRRRTQSKL